MAFVRTLVLLASLFFVAFGSPTGPRNPDWKHHGGYGPGGKPSHHGDEVTVDLGYATYKGVGLAAGVKQFLGIRFAAPPLGNLRWRAPQAPKREEGVQDASTFKPICVGTNEQVNVNQTEDCLFLNVFAPSNAGPESKLPVWFFIQGGGYANNSNANYNGTDVVVKSNHNVVLVNFNYRVGAFGFLASEKVRQDGDLNVGLLDERAALHWVQKYIHLFGGDKEHVVIHGDSAGGGSVAFQLTAYGGRDDKLFVGAIPESPFFPTHRTVPELEFQYTRFLKDIGCDTARNPLACARSTDVNTIQAANVLKNHRFPGAPGDPLWYFLPCIDGDLSRQNLLTAFEEGNFIKVPTMVAGDTNEGDIFAPNASSPTDVANFVKSNYPKLNSQQLNEINQLYPKEAPRPPNAAFFPSASDAYGDSTFTCGGLVMADAVAKRLSPNEIWVYRYNVIDPANAAIGFLSTHTSEIPAIFGVGFAGGEGTALQTTNAAVVPIVMDYYLSFVQTLNPNKLKSSTAPTWDAYDAGRTPERLLIEVTNSRMETIPQIQETRCALWDRLSPVMEQ